MSEQLTNESRVGDPIDRVEKTQWLTLAEACTYTRFSRSHLYHNIESIPHYRVGRSIRFRRDDLEAWLTASPVGR